MYMRKSFTDGYLHLSARRGVITLLPKPNKDLLEIKNWRPLTLLNVDYKIMAKVIAFRIKEVLPSIIHHDQTGFMANRYIGENIIKSIDLIDYAEEKNIPALIFTIDFEKAFDMVEWHIVQKASGIILKKWVSIYYIRIFLAV